MAEDTQGTDDPRAKKDAGSKKQKLPAPGKTTNGDTAGVTPAVPGKRTNTDGMAPDGAPGVGKSTQVDGQEGKDGGEVKNVAGGGGGGAGADKKADGDHNAAAADDAKTGAAGGGGKKGANGATGKKDKEPAVKAKAPANGDEAKNGAPPVKEGAALHEPKMMVAPQRIDAPAPSAIPNITLGPPKANKNLSDTWVKETGRTVEQHHEQIANALNAVTAEIQTLQTALTAEAESEAAKVTSEITAKVDGFKSALVAPGKQRVETAYAGLGKGFETAEQKALADIAKNKATGKAAIDTAKKTNGDGISKKIVAAKAMVGGTVAKNVPAASAAIKKWAGGIPVWVKAAKDQAKTASEAAAKNFNPSKGNAGSKDSAFIALEEDVKKNHTLKHGEKLGKQYEGALLGWSKDTDKKADELVRKALDASKVEFEAALDTADSASKKGFDEALKGANTTLDTGETTAKKAVTDSKTNGIKKFESEKKDAVDAADKAGKELADNSNAAGTELTDRIKKKAADDAKNYALVVADLQKKFAGGKPMKFEDAKVKIDAAKAQVTKLHETNTTELKTLVTEGKGALVGTLTKQSDIFEKAIKDREVSAKKTEQDVIKDIGKGAETMSASLGNIGKTFTDVTEKESKRVDAMVTAFNQNADAATKDFGTKISAHLETSRKGLEDNLKANLEPAKMAEDTQGGIQQEVASKKKSLDTDTGTLRSAMDGWGTDENKIYGVLRKCSHGEITYLEASYQDHYPQRAKGGNNALRADFAEEMGGNDLKTAMSYLNHDRATAIKLELADSKGFWNDDEARIEEVLRGASEEEIKFLNTDPEAIKIVNDVKGNLGGSDLDMMNTLLDTSIDKDDRKVKADAISLFQTMDGLGTDEAKMKKLLSECKTEEERAKLRAQFNQYAKSKGWEGGDGSEGNDALTLAIKDDVGTGMFGNDKGEQNHMLALASVKRDEDDIKAAKMVEGADGGGTNEDAIFEALDDEEYAKKWAAASPEDKKKLEEARRKMLDAKVAKMSGGKWDTAQGLIDDEMDKANLTWGEFVDGKRENGTPLTAQEIARVKSRDPGINKLQWMVAQRKLQTGAAEPELMLAYAMWGVTGTDEDAIKKVFGPEPKPIAAVKAITGAFATRWGVPLVSHCELEDMKRGAPTGVLANELSGKDWFATRMLLAGKPETAEQLKYISDQRAKFNKGGAISGALMDLGEAVGFTEAKSTAEATEARFNKEYAEKFGKNPTAKLGTADSKTLEELADYLQQDYEAYSASLNSIVDGIVMALEIVGGVIITVVTAGTASPILAAIIANLVLSAGTITFKYAALGDQYGAAELGADIVKAVGTSAFAGLGELKALTNITQQAGNKVAGGVQKLSQLANSAANKAGMKLAQNGALEMGEQATTKLAGIVAAGTKNVILGAGQEVYGALTDEKTYDKKFGEALWGEDSIGAKILKGIPKSFAEGAVTQWINESAGTSNKDNAGNSTGPRSNALTNAIAEMGGATAGFFVYVDNYKDAEQFWMGLLKANANKAISGAMNGYAMHKARANKLGRDFLNGDMGAEGLTKMAKESLDPSEVAALAKFVKQYGTPEQAAALPDAFKATLPKTETAPAATNTPAATTSTPATTTKAAANTNVPVESKDDGVPTVKPGETAAAKPVVLTDPALVKDKDAPVAPKPILAGDDEKTAATPKVVKPAVDADEEKAATAEPKKPKLKLVDDEDKKETAEPADESKVAAAAAKIKADEAEAARVIAQKKKDDAEKKVAIVADDEEKSTTTTKPPAKPAIDAADKPTQKQLDDGHAGIEVHSHFMGNVEADSIKSVVGGAARANKDGMVSEWEPVLREISRLDMQNADGFRHTRDDKSGDITKRGKSGDAMDLVEAARADIAKLKNEKTRAENGTGRFAEMSEADRKAHADGLVKQIDDVARNAVKKALAASDETDFNSSYEVRDELVKKFYGADDRKGVLPSGHIAAVDLDPKKRTALQEHFAGRPEVLERIRQASELSEQGKKGPLSETDQKKLDGLKKQIEEQFSYDQYAKQTIARLAEDNISYTEQSNSAKKLGTRFDPEQFGVLKDQLIAEQKKIVDSEKSDPEARAAAQKKITQLENLQIANLTMTNTSNFGERDFGEEFGANKRSSIEDFKNKEVAGIVKQVKDRKDTAGVDIAGAEHFRFDEGGQARMRILYDALAEVGTPDRPVVLRPHVGEGANDTEAGKQGHRDANRRTTKDGELTHYERARHNIDKMLEVFGDIAKANGGEMPKNVIVRFGHVSHATPEQAAKMAKLGIIAEVNLSSNVETGAVDQNPGGKPRPPQSDGEKRPDRLEDHSLPSLIKEGAPVILSTDAHAVMNTNLSKEYAKAKALIEEIRSGQRPVRVSVEEAKTRGYQVVEGPPPHGLAHYHQLPDVEKKRFDAAYEKMYADANKYFKGRPKQDGEGGDDEKSTTPKKPDDGPSSNDSPDVADAKKKQVSQDDQQKHLDQLVKDLASDNVYQRTKAQSELDALKKNPEWDAAFKLKGIYQTAKKHQDEGPDTKMLSDNIPAMLAEADKARIGKDPVLQGKRDQFERALALEILKEGPIRQQVDAELAKMCDKARDYIMKTRAAGDEQEKALAGLGTDKKKGYGGGLKDDSKTQKQNADTILDVLQNGNIRERMLALGEFMNMMGKDALTPEGKQKLQKMAQGPQEGAYSPADAAKMLERVKQYEQEEQKTDKRSVKGLFVPNAEEKAGAHKDYADAKSQDMDTKLPALLHDKVQAFLGHEQGGDESKLTKKGEESPLARTTITVKEAMEKGLQLSPREVAAAGGEDAQLGWVVGQRANLINPAAPFVAAAKEESMPLKAGVSGTTYRWMQLVSMLDGNLNMGRLAAIASLQAADAHSFHEIASASKGFGVDYNSSNPYANVGIDEGALRALAAKQGTTLEELNGKKPDPQSEDQKDG